MGREDWYRNTEWNPEIEQEFHSRLKRSRSQRDQNLVIQALTLAKHQPQKALELVEFFFETRTNDFEDMRAYLAGANAYIELNDLENTLEWYKKVLKREKECPKHLSTTYLDYPYLVAKEKIEAEYEHALEVLLENVDRPMFPSDHYQWNAALALITYEQGDKEKSMKHAALALEAAQIKKSGFRYHQNVGIVGKEYKNEIKELQKIGT